MASVVDDYHGQPRPSTRTIGAVERGSTPKKTWPPVFVFSKQAPYTGEPSQGCLAGRRAPSLVEHAACYQALHLSASQHLLRPLDCA